MRLRVSYTALALAGTLPFVGAAALLVLGRRSLGPLDDVVGTVASYGLAIICFLAGAHWATQLYRGDGLPMNLFIASNVVVLAVWFAFLLGGPASTLIAQLLAFAFLLYVDYGLLQRSIIDATYFRARLVATSIACPCLLVVLVAT